MGYFEYFKSLLKPMGIYDLESGAGALELRAAGRQMDSILSDIDISERESAVFTAESYGLSLYREILSYYPVYAGLDEIRRALAAMLQIDGGSFTQDALNATISGCGVLASVTESGTPQTVIVTFPDIRGVPQNFDEIKERVEAILPCHLNIEYQILYLRWIELEAHYLNWLELEASAGCWRELERLK